MMPIHESDVIDPADVVAATGKAYWYSFGYPPPIRSAVIVSRSAIDAALGDERSFRRLGRVMVMTCTAITSETATFFRARSGLMANRPDTAAVNVAVAAEHHCEFARIS